MFHDPLFWRTAGKVATVGIICAVLYIWLFVLAVKAAKRAGRNQAVLEYLREVQSEFHYRTGPTDEDYDYQAFMNDNAVEIDTTDERRLA